MNTLHKIFIGKILKREMGFIGAVINGGCCIRNIGFFVRKGRVIYGDFRTKCTLTFDGS